MEFLVQLIGWYLLIGGAVALFRGRSLMPAVTELAKNRPLLIVLWTIELIAGLALVVAYPQVSISLAGFISLLGYMMVIESLIYLSLPSQIIRSFVGAFNRRAWYIGGGIASMAGGLYLLLTIFELI